MFSEPKSASHVITRQRAKQYFPHALTLALQAFADGLDEPDIILKVMLRVKVGMALEQLNKDPHEANIFAHPVLERFTLDGKYLVSLSGQSEHLVLTVMQDIDPHLLLSAFIMLLANALYEEPIPPAGVVHFITGEQGAAARENAADLALRIEVLSDTAGSWAPAKKMVS